MTDFEDQLRQRMRAEVSGVRPDDRLAAIRRRTESTRPSWWVPAFSGLAAVGLVAAAISVAKVLPAGDRDPATQVAGPSQSAGDSTPQAPTQTSAVAGRQVTVWVLRTESERIPSDARYLDASLFPATRIVESVPGENPGLDAVRALLAYDLADDGDALNVWVDGLGTDQPPDIDVRSVEQRDGQVIVDFAGPVDEPWPTTMVTWAVDPALFSQQLVRTVQGALDTSDPVLVTRDGRPVDSVLTAPVDQPIQASDADLAPVHVTKLGGDVVVMPTDDKLETAVRVHGPLRVTGESNTFEATVNWRVLRGSDVVREGYAMGGSYGEWKPFSFDVDLPPGSYTVEVYEVSAEDGSQQSLNTIHVRVT